MNLQQIEYALLLQKHGSFSKAAKQGGLTQSAVSQQITKLENELGFQIFDRQTKPIKPTATGFRFLEKAQMVLLEVQQLKEFAIQLEEEAEGALTIGIIPTLSPYLVPFFINELNEKYPKIKLTIREMMTKDIVRGIIDRELNGGIISTPITTNMKFEFEPLFYEKFFLYASYKHPLFEKNKVDIADIKADDLWLLNEGNCFSDQVNNMCQIGARSDIKPDLDYRSNSIDALRRIVEYKGGLTFLPELATLNVSESEEDMIKKLEGKPRAREISLIYTKGETKKPLMQKMAAVIKESLPKSVLSKEDKIMVKTNVEV
ncbi:MAG: LysR family hydrogen peroxide-inducible transcriptional activator [Saprospiraceae bacterium]|jgi:LysR family hydrogen peroxide-inducible transcriptional activator